jgi:hypothetical protein
MSQLLIQSFQLVKGVAFLPRSTLNHIKKGDIAKGNVYFIFVVTMIVTLAKAPFITWNRSFNVFSNQPLNEIIIFLNNPFAMWAREYLLYFCILFLFVKSCKLFTKGQECQEMPCMIIAVSGIGIVAQLLFFLLSYLLTKESLRHLGLIVYLWNFVLIFFAVKISSSLSYAKAFIIVLVPLGILAISPFGIWSFMSPYLLFLF